MDLMHFHQITPRIGTAGHPKPADFPAIAAAGYEVVINLAMHDAESGDDYLVRAVSRVHHGRTIGS